MSCFHPLPAAIAYDGRSGKTCARVLRRGERVLDETGRPDYMELPCGRCIGCKLENSRGWAVRMMHEAQLYDANQFVTLDYDPEHLPVSRSLEYRDFQLFMKRLRKEVRGVSRGPSGKFPIRFFCAGEYGEKFRRPHWHAILFNMVFGDQVQFVNGTYRSSQAESLWGRGSVVIDAVTPRSCAYVAGYTLSKRYGSRSAESYEDVVNVVTGEVSSRRPEFCTMSRRPGIGSWWYDRFSSDVFPADRVVVEGEERKAPRYYWRKFQQTADPLLVAQLEAARVERARAVPVEESSERRRCDREAVARSRLKTFSERSH